MKVQVPGDVLERAQEFLRSQPRQPYSWDEAFKWGFQKGIDEANEQLETITEKAIESEQARWQVAILEACNASKFDYIAGGSDTSDPLDYALDSIKGCFVDAQDRIDEMFSSAHPKWQPIETAPMDGTEILICQALDADHKPIEGEDWGIFVHRAAWWGWDEGWIVYNSQVSDPKCFFTPTHWMPIPAGPYATTQPKWQPVVGQLVAAWGHNYYKEDNLETVVGIYQAQKSHDGYHIIKGFNDENDFYRSHVAALESLDEIGKPPSYFIERGRATV